VNKKDGEIEMTFSPKFDTPAGEYKIVITVTDSDDVEIEKKFKLTIVEDAAFDANKFKVFKFVPTKERMKGKTVFADDGVPLNCTITEITADGLVKLDYNYPVLIPPELRNMTKYTDSLLKVEFV